MNTSNLSTVELKNHIALEMLIDPEIMCMSGSCVASQAFMRNALQDYQHIDAKAVMGAQHLADFLKDNINGPIEFEKLMRLCDSKPLNLAILTRATQLGLVNPKGFIIPIHCDDPAQAFQHLNSKIAAMGVILIDKSHQTEASA